MKTTTGSLGALNQALDQFTDKARQAQAEARRVQSFTTPAAALAAEPLTAPQPSRTDSDLIAQLITMKSATE